MCYTLLDYDEYFIAKRRDFTSFNFSPSVVFVGNSSMVQARKLKSRLMKEITKGVFISQSFILSGSLLPISFIRSVGDH